MDRVENIVFSHLVSKNAKCIYKEDAKVDNVNEEVSLFQ